eukprot:2161392-Amphidinium_carterae.1
MYEPSRRFVRDAANGVATNDQALVIIVQWVQQESCNDLSSSGTASRQLAHVRQFPPAHENKPFILIAKMGVGSHTFARPVSSGTSKLGMVNTIYAASYLLACRLCLKVFSSLRPTLRNAWVANYSLIRPSCAYHLNDVSTNSRQAPL